MSSQENLLDLNSSYQLSDEKITPIVNLLLNDKQSRKMSLDDIRSRGGQSSLKELSFNIETTKLCVPDFPADGDSDLEVLVSDCDSRNSGDREENKFQLVGSAIRFTPCLRCTGAAPHELLMRQSAINEMCHRLCSDDCRLSLSLTGFIAKNQDESKIPKPGEDQSFKSHECYEISNDVHVNAADSQCHPNLKGKDYVDTNGMNYFDPFDIEELEKEDKTFDVIEALERISSLTSSQMNRRLVARKLELEMHSSLSNNAGDACKRFDADGSSDESCQTNDFNDVSTFNERKLEFPREYLQFLLRMGSFNSAPKIQNIDSQDDGFEIPRSLSGPELLQYIKKLRNENFPPLLTRYFSKPLENNMVAQEITDDLRFLKLKSNNEARLESITPPNHIRLLQWNILSQSLGQNNDGFVCCPDEALLWDNRKFLIVQEILQHNPDLICLQEVDHFKFLQKIFATQNYDGFFFPKPDSPCLYIGENNGPDGCAIFYKRDKFDLINLDTRILEVWHVQSNQIAVAANLRIRSSDKEICVCTTHLKARKGSLLSKLRNEQGRDLLRFTKSFSDSRPIILCGDFNAEPVEPVYSTILSSDILNLSSAYADINNVKEQEGGRTSELAPTEMLEKISLSIAREPPYTTWKIREEGEICHTIDYVFYTKGCLEVKNCLEFPQDEEIGKNRTPNIQYPSDHFSLVCDFQIMQ